MKKTLLALSIATAGQLAADCCNESCEPCCVPQPKKCIDCECYTPPYYDLQCACDFFITADFLYWYGKETGLSYAVKGDNAPILETAIGTITFPMPTENKWMKESWDPGVRVGIGANDVFCDGWDLYLYWTYFHTKKKQSTSIGGRDQFLLNPWNELIPIADIFTLQVDPEDIESFADSISAKWKLDFNTFDLELGRNYWLSSCFSMRPYMGIRGGWTKTRFSNSQMTSITTTPPDPLTIISSEDSKFKNKFWGVGLSGGFQPNWHLGCGFSLFGNADLALLWGCFDIDRKGSFFLAGGERAPELSINAETFQSKFSAMQAILDLAAGLRYECTYCCDSYRLAIDLGWEHHMWFDHNHRNQFDAEVIPPANEERNARFDFNDYKEIYGNLVLAGLVVRARFDF